MEITDHLGRILGRKGRPRSAKHRSAVDKGLHDKVGHCHGERWHQKATGRRVKENKCKKNHTILLFLESPAPRLWFRSKGSEIKEERTQHHQRSHAPFPFRDEPRQCVRWRLPSMTMYLEVHCLLKVVRRACWRMHTTCSLKSKSSV